MDMLNISAESVIQLRELWLRSENRENYAIRLYISGFSYEGLEWGLTLDSYDPESDECCDFEDFRVIVERELLHAVGGLDVQYENYGEGGGFLITAKDSDIQSLYGGCSGCGGHCGSCGGHCGSCGGHCESCGEHCESCDEYSDDEDF